MGTQPQHVSEATSPFLTTAFYVVPQFPLCISDVRVARSNMEAPFRGTFKGVLFDVGASGATQQGGVKLELKLMDFTGARVQYFALGKHTSNPMLNVCVEVVIYFGTGCGPIGRIEGMLYVMKDAAVVLVVQQTSMPMKSIHIPIVNRST